MHTSKVGVTVQLLVQNYPAAGVLCMETHTEQGEAYFRNFTTL